MSSQIRARQTVPAEIPLYLRGEAACRLLPSAPTGQCLGHRLRKMARSPTTNSGLEPPHFAVTEPGWPAFAQKDDVTWLFSQPAFRSQGPHAVALPPGQPKLSRCCPVRINEPWLAPSRLFPALSTSLVSTAHTHLAAPALSMQGWHQGR